MQQVVSLNFHENWHKKDKLFICMEYGKLFAAKDYLNFVFIQRAYCEAVTNVINRLRTRNILNSIKFIKKQRNRILVTSVSLFLARFQIWRFTKEDTPEKIHLYAPTVHNHSDIKRHKSSHCEKISQWKIFWISYWLHLFDFSPLCVFKCFLKVTAWIDAKSHWLHLFEFSPLCVLKCLHLKM